MTATNNEARNSALTTEQIDSIREQFRQGEMPSRAMVQRIAMLAAPPAAPALGEDAYVARRMTETLAEVYGTIIGDDARQEDESLNAIERVKRAAQVLRIEVDLYRAQRDEAAAPAQSGEPVAWPDDPATTGIGRLCQPGDQSEPRWLLTFDDADRNSCMFDTEAEARKAFANAEGRGWNCWLFGPTLRAAAPQPSQPVEAGDPVLPVWFDTFLTNVCEIPDRNSPEGEPEAMIATAEELRNCALNAIENTAANARDRDERPISPADISAAADAVQRTYGVSGDIAEQIAVAVIDTLIARGNHPPYSVPSAVVLHDERAAFEAWMRGCEGYPYAGQYANLMWKAWQARAASPQATATQPVQTERALTGIDQIAAVLASEIECGIFERHVVPALDAARKVLASGDKA